MTIDFEKEIEVKNQEIQSLKATLRQLLTIVDSKDRTDDLAKLKDIKTVIKQELAIKD